jgi:transposase-like protein
MRRHGTPLTAIGPQFVTNGATAYDFPAEHWKHLRTTNVIESAPEKPATHAISDRPSVRSAYKEREPLPLTNIHATSAATMCRTESSR